ncbi:hypothetical protein [Pelagerythrobacter sp.]|uniref:hypothetical protein n=1 Tax=Pelagerythrobacter sp. TaxID=2800702 RepID=UPI0035B23D73
MPVSDDFMDGVWERAGRLQARREARGRLMLLACLAIVGLGAGATVAQAPAYAEPRTYVVSSEAHLSPAALLQVEP